MSRHQLLREHTARDLQEWAAYQRIRGSIGPQRGDLQAGIIASAAVAPHCKKGRVPAPIEFMPFCKRRVQRAMSNDAIRAVFEEANAGFARK